MKNNVAPRVSVAKNEVRLYNASVEVAKDNARGFCNDCYSGCEERFGPKFKVCSLRRLPKDWKEECLGCDGSMPSLLYHTR